MRRKGVSGSAFFNKPATETVHQKSKFKAIKLCYFKMDLIKWQLNFGSCNFGLKSNRTRAARSFDFEITRMISDQIAFHSVQLPLLIS